MSRHVAILMGGWSAEREVSLVSGAAVAEALVELGHRVSPIDVDRNAGREITELGPDVVFNALHGRYGEDGCFQGLLEVLGIPYTHSGVLASALAMDKPMAKTLFAREGLRCAEGRVVHRDEVLADEVMEAPYVIKPLNEGSSVGVKIVLEGDNCEPQADEPWNFGDQVLVERYIPGREIHVAVMGDAAVGAVEIRPKGRFYDYQAKYTEGFAEHLMPAPMAPERYRESLDIALRAHVALGCRGVSRADLRFDEESAEEGGFYLLEINTQPGLTPLSLVPEIAAHSGIGFVELVEWMLEDAGCQR
ncbi:MAG TPA: D-alanine--D-alanine ligase [Alphaproteobacteria bacterium]|nr:D-alanine--D-alanine ligase [Alphaproteobacteria bacterium]MDP6270544.1 D-alanine--D-alanine ligase [Alphaproteobacteria bacterium]MDP7164747.1 D-alanine--D-alanine ligase [Alphaproteobacteria bacterium]MDP7428307.1 D-alanine--D-alanine ligase [Alphaproteobacteria bacterium]HJM51766.1 D-alanine--D-alanine ligase [Alphaproteobacteria bacterium]